MHDIDIAYTGSFIKSFAAFVGYQLFDENTGIEEVMQLVLGTAT